MSKLYALFLVLFMSTVTVTCFGTDDEVESTDWISTGTGSGR